MSRNHIFTAKFSMVALDRHSIVREFKGIFRLILRLLMLVLGLFLWKRALFPSEYSIYVIRKSGFFRHFSRFNIENLNRMHNANSHFEQGHFLESTRQHRDLLTEVRNRSRFIMTDTYSYEFATNIGHLAILALHQSAQGIGLLPQRRMLLPTSNSAFQDIWIPLLRESWLIEPIHDNSPSTLLPQNWDRVESLRMFQTENGYVDMYSFNERYFQDVVIDQHNRVFELENWYLEKSRQFLSSIGLPDCAQFISLHVREGSRGDLRRSQNILNYESTITSFVDQGYWVIRIGDDNMQGLSHKNGFLDLRGSDFQWLHPFILYTAKIHLGTNSGPSWMSQVMGTPTLVTNSTSLARNTITGNRHTMYIPKHLFVEGKRMNFRQNISHLEGYSELDGPNLTSRSISYVENSPEEILLAALELLSEVENPLSNTTLSTYDRTVNQIRVESGALSFGRLANSFFNLHPLYLE